MLIATLVYRGDTGSEMLGFDNGSLFSNINDGPMFPDDDDDVGFFASSSTDGITSYVPTHAL